MNNRISVSFDRMMGFAMFGIACTGLLGATVLGLGIWWLVHHVTF